MECKITAYKSIEDCKEAWKQNININNSLEIDALRVFEKAKPTGFTFEYLLIKEKSNEEVIACCYLQHIIIGPNQLSIHTNYLLNFLIKILLFIKPFKVIYCGNLFKAECCGFTAFGNLSEKNIIDLVKSWYKKHTYDLLLFKNLKPDLITALANGKEAIAFDQDLTMKLQIKNEWQSLNDYITSLSKKYKKRAEKILCSNENLQYKQLSIEEIRINSKRIEYLFDQIVEKQQIKLGRVDIKYFLACQEYLGNKFKFMAIYAKAEMVGFYTTLSYLDEHEIHFVGIDQLANLQYQIYFNILFKGLEEAILSKQKFLELGRTAREAKAILGAKPIRSLDLLFPKNLRTKFVLQKATAAFNETQGAIWQSRNPFK
ncbi:MAG: hypothetical protein RIQ89_2151 [Bacteroidota bacterium]